MKSETCILTGAVLLILGGCAAGERTATLRPTAVRSARDVHAAAARAHPATLQRWEEASRRALRSGLHITPSFRERIVLDRDVQAVAYRLTLVRGQSLRVRVAPAAGVPAAFTDMFHHVGSDLFRPVHWARESPGSSTFVARAAGDYVLRIQPPIGATGIYDVTVSSDASLVFPVAGADRSAIGGVFGDPRDGGARAHEGVDIFAPYGTAVVAAADGRIQQARNTPTGGLVIWQADAASALTYYYAHLAELLVRDGTVVRAGDVIGRVGNTGNARGTPPHLHFAIYRPGTIPIDPVPLLAARVVRHDAVIHGRFLGERTRVNETGVQLRRSPSHAGAIITELSPAMTLRVVGDSGDWQRVVLPDGTTGFVAAHLTEAASAGTREP
jgi:murein DD-endopeptidase MepM/ murein hydrolase activator NlpD